MLRGILQSTPALARFGSDEVRAQFLTPTIKGDFVACLGVSELGAGSDVASVKWVFSVRCGGSFFVDFSYNSGPEL